MTNSTRLQYEPFTIFLLPSNKPTVIKTRKNKGRMQRIQFQNNAWKKSWKANNDKKKTLFAQFNKIQIK